MTIRRADVVLASGSFWPREGGAERQMRAVLNAASETGLRCAVVTQALRGQPRRARVDGADVHRVGSARLLRYLPRLGQMVCTLAQAYTLLRLQPQTAVSIQMGAASVAVALVRQIRPVRHVVRLTGGGTGRWRSEPWVRRSSLVGRLVVRLVTGRGVIVVSPARHLVDDFTEAFPRSMATTQVIPNGVADPGEGRPDTESIAGIAWYARGGAVKSTATFSGVVAACPDLPFIALGRTDNLPDYPSISKLGWVTDPYPVLRGCRVLLNTSPTEGMPNMALQALAVGLHVLGPPNEGLVELSQAYPDWVTVMDFSDPLAVAAALRALHRAPLLGPAPVPRAPQVAKLWTQLFLHRS